jgi:hypothetical protein
VLAGFWFNWNELAELARQLHAHSLLWSAASSGWNRASATRPAENVASYRAEDLLARAEGRSSYAIAAPVPAVPTIADADPQGAGATRSVSRMEAHGH